MDLCDICKSIPFHRLPSEEDAGYPHQPSLHALEASAAKCKLCEFILEAVNELKKTLEDEQKKDEGNRSGGLERFSTTPTGVSQKTHFGNALPSNRNPVYESPGLDFANYNWPGPPSDAIPSNHDTTKGMRKLLRFFKRLWHKHTDVGDVLRPWLYGNWWVLGPPIEGVGPDYQLIGIGVRIGRKPGILDAEGNSNNMVHCRGSSLRVRTEDGELEVFMQFGFTKFLQIHLRPLGFLGDCEHLIPALYSPCAEHKAGPIIAIFTTCALLFYPRCRLAFLTLEMIQQHSGSGW